MPCGRSEAKLKFEAKRKLRPQGEQPAKAPSSADSASQLGRKSPQSEGSQSDEGIVCGPMGELQCERSDTSSAGPRLVHKPQAFAANLAPNPARHSADPSGAQRVEQTNDQNLNQNQSVELQASGRNMALQRSGKFAAIHECLEPLFLQQARAPSGDQPQHNNLGQAHQRDQQHQGDAAGKSQSVSELEHSNSLINRLWSRLLPGQGRRTSGASRRIKARPIISMPVNVTSQRTSLGRAANLSNSLTMLAMSAQQDSKPDGSKSNSVNLNHINAGHLVSSSANLIQDSTTGSDGTASSSGRSSSSSSGGGRNRELCAPVQEAQANGGFVDGANGYMQQAMWMQGPLTVSSVAPAKMSPNGLYRMNAGQLDCAMYVNNENVAYASDHNLAQLYQTNGQLSYDTGLDQSAHTTNDYTSQPLAWSDQNQAIPAGHYQLPAMIADPYFASTQQNGRPCYATICNKPVQQFVAASAANYATLQMSPTGGQCHSVVPTSDADAFFESNYGTLLSRSSAYKTLGYATSPNTFSPAQPTCHSASSSPNSLTTHANNLSNNPNLDQMAQHAPVISDSRFQDSPAIIVQSNGSATSAKNLNDKGLATHV